MNIFGYDFKGPHKISDGIIEDAAVYIVVDDQNKVVDVGEVGEEGMEFSKSERKSCWEENNGEEFYVAKMPPEEYEKKDREMLENQIRETINNIPCGRK